jgi:hypothetical protein
VLDGRLDVLRVVDAGDHHHGRVGVLGPELAEKAVTGFVRQLHVEEGERVLGAFNEHAGCCAAERDVGNEAPAFQSALHDLASASSSSTMSVRGDPSEADTECSVRTPA